MKYFLSHNEDQQMIPVRQQALQDAEAYVRIAKEIFLNEGCPVPTGFHDTDVHLDAPRLFGDSYHMHYLYTMTGLGLSFYSIALPNTARKDVRDFFMKTINQCARLFSIVADVMLSKAIASAKIRLFGDALAISTRHDLVPLFARTLLETGKYAHKGADLLIKHGWLERIPEAADREALAKL